MGDEIRNLETDLILLSARGKRLLMLRRGVEFAAVVLDRGDVEAMQTSRSQYTARRLGEAVRLARIAVESGQG